MGIQDREYTQPEPTIPAGYRPDGRHDRFSIVTTLIVINVVLFLLPMFSQRLAIFIYSWGVLEPLAVIKGEVWRMITAQYLHAGPMHLLFNMIALHFLGRPLERKWSARRFLVIYTACGLAGNFFYVLLGWRGVIHPEMQAVGASGAIYGILGIIAVQYPHARLLLYFILPIKIRTAAIILGAISFFTVIERGGNYGGEACHLAGLVFGVWWAMHGEQWWESTEWIFSSRKSGR